MPVFGRHADGGVEDDELLPSVDRVDRVLGAREAGRDRDVVQLAAERPAWERDEAEVLLLDLVEDRRRDGPAVEERVLAELVALLLLVRPGGHDGHAVREEDVERNERHEVGRQPVELLAGRRVERVGRPGVVAHPGRPPHLVEPLGVREVDQASDLPVRDERSSTLQVGTLPDLFDQFGQRNRVAHVNPSSLLVVPIVLGVDGKSRLGAARFVRGWNVTARRPPAKVGGLILTPPRPRPSPRRPRSTHPRPSTSRGPPSWRRAPWRASPRRST